jgi:hypothetical protein
MSISGYSDVFGEGMRMVTINITKDHKREILPPSRKE